MEKLKHFLSSHGIVYTVYVHEPVVTIEDVERVLKIPKTAMVKSLVVKVHDTIYIAAVLGSQRLNKKKLSHVLGISRNHIDLLERKEVEEALGMPIGANPPFGLGIPAILDLRILGEKKIYCGFGSLTESIMISSKDIARISKAIVADISESEVN